MTHVTLTVSTAQGRHAERWTPTDDHCPNCGRRTVYQGDRATSTGLPLLCAACATSFQWQPRSSDHTDQRLAQLPKPPVASGAHTLRRAATQLRAYRAFLQSRPSLIDPRSMSNLTSTINGVEHLMDTIRAQNPYEDYP